MRLVRLDVFNQHFIPVKFEKINSVAVEKRVRKYLLGRIVVFLIIKPVNASEIGYSAFRRYTGAAEKYYFITFVNNLL